MQTVFQANLGSFPVRCHTCRGTKYLDLIVDEEQIEAMFFKIKLEFERMLFLGHFDRARIAELTRLSYVIIPRPFVQTRLIQKEIKPASTGAATCCPDLSDMAAIPEDTCNCHSV